MNNWKKLFGDGCFTVAGTDGCYMDSISVNDLYQAFKTRGEAEDRDDGICRYLGDTDVCTHPSNKPPEPECEHGYYTDKTFSCFVSYTDKHCRDCGKKLDYH